jgi:hypothetical protein
MSLYTRCKQRNAQAGLSFLEVQLPGKQSSRSLVK